jgi:uncharacterized protein
LFQALFINGVILQKLNKSILKEVVTKLVDSSHPKKIILFGSYARNEMTEGSDIDILIVKDQVISKGTEMVRLRNYIGNIGVGVDLLLYSQQEINEWGHLPGTALYSALKEGKIIYEAPN